MASQAAHKLRRVSAFVLRLVTPRPLFALDMSEEERAVMERHAARW